MRTPHGGPPPYLSNQARAWKGDFGNHYTDRNQGRVPANRAFFRKALAEVIWSGPGRVLELGCGAGENLQALRQIYPGHHLEGVEINAKAASIARNHLHLVREHSILDYYTEEPFDLVFSKGVLIHVHPKDLHRAYEVMVRSSRRWVLVAEYYNPTPMEIPYRGQAGLLWKRDFAGELLTLYQELRLVDYGFTYHRDPYPQDDLHFFLMEKKQ